jgi:hypothetical protein
LRPLHVDDNFFRHPNGAVSTPFLLPNLMSNHLTIALLLDDIGGALAIISPVGLGVDERTLDGETLGLRILIGPVAFFIALEACHG